jgi:organic hydroperoxide reductase OsmC/OhrA
MDRHQYYVDIHWDSDRKGIMCSPELNVSQSEKGCIEVATPPQFPKGMPGIWSPEHLFTASVSSCFMTTFLAIAENSKLNFKSFDCKATGILEQVDSKFLMTEIQLEPAVTITNEKDKDLTLRILQRTEMNCLITNSIKSKVSMKSSIKIHEPVAEKATA